MTAAGTCAPHCSPTRQRHEDRPRGDLRPGTLRAPLTDEADAVRIANDSDYGLAGSVWSADVSHGLQIAAEIRTGTYGINMYQLDTSAPFGGFKQSGIGRKFGPEGLAQYTEMRSTVTGANYRLLSPTDSAALQRPPPSAFQPR